VSTAKDTLCAFATNKISVNTTLVERLFAL
jgi:hypothetical protein